MQASAFVGRVGGLAVVLGIGAAVSLGGGAVACASPGDASASPSGESGTGSAQSSAAGAPVRRAAAARGRSSERSSAPKPASTTRSRDAFPLSAPVTVTPKAAKDSTPAPSASVSLPQADAVDRAVVDAAAPAAVVTRVRLARSNPIAVQSVPAPTSAVVAPALTPVTAPVMAAAAPQPAAAAGAVESVPAPLLGNGTGAPAQSQMSWVMLAAARRELDSAAATPSAAATVSTAQPLASAAAPVPANRPPTIDRVDLGGLWGLGSGAGVGAGNIDQYVVQVIVKAHDVNGDPLTYTATPNSIKGSVKPDPTGGNPGSFWYTPTLAARDAAGRKGNTAADRNDTVTVTVTDAKGAVATRVVAVPIAPSNKLPLYAQPSVGQPVRTTGIVTGNLRAIGADVVTYDFPSTTSKGAVTIDALGNFTYTPYAEARIALWDKNNGPNPFGSDTFTVTETDVYGKKLVVPVKVSIMPATRADTATVSIGAPDPVTGIAKGTVNSNYKLTYRTSLLDGLSTKTGLLQPGQLKVKTDGSFTFTPTAEARAYARSSKTAISQPLGIVVIDAKGNQAFLAFSTIIAPSNSAPVAGTPTSTTDSTTGVVTGEVNAKDPNKDALTYTAATTTTSKGSAVVTADGAFTYTPSTTARHDASKTGAPATDTADTFAVTVTDKYGAASSISVKVAITPSNTAPVARITKVGFPDPVNGVVTGSVVATDADLDTLTYSAPTATAKGGVTVGTDGHFTYTPNPAAREAAARENASAADLADEFTVTVNDSHGGSTAVPVKVAVSPAPPLVGIDYRQSPYLGEGNGGVTVNPLTVKLSRASADPVVVSYLITNSGSATPGVDFIAEQGSVGFAPGQTEAVIPVKLFGDAAVEPDESFSVFLTGASNATLVNGIQGGLTKYFTPIIKNDDALTGPVSVGFDYEQSPNLIEGDSGTTVNPVRVRLSGPSTQTVTVSYSFLYTGQATPEEDFVPTPGTVVFAPGQTLATIPVGVLGDVAPEDDESFRVLLDTATNADVVEGIQDGLSPSFNVTIVNDDTYDA